jgi:peptide/nickel transport system substrate-binding protein
MNKLLFCVSAVILLVCILISGCSKETTTAAPATKPVISTNAVQTSAAPAATTVSVKSGGIIKLICNEGTTASIGVPQRMQGMSPEYAFPMIERLIQYSNTGEFIPKLATSYEYSNDNKTVTFHLRQGVKFHDGSDFNADVVKWNFQRYVTDKVAGSDNIDSIETTDAYTVKVNLKQFLNAWISKVGGEYPSDILGMMISRQNVEKNGEKYADEHPVGTGPFKFKGYQPDASLDLERNNDYWGGKTLIDGIHWIFIKDTVAAEMSFESGEADGIRLSGSPAQLEQDLVPKGYPPAYFTGLNLFMIPASARANSVLAKIEVRQAIEYAINKEKIVQSTLGGYATPIYQMCNPQMSPYIQNFQGNQYDPTKAKKLLADIGMPKINTTIYVTSLLGGDAVTAVQSYLQAVGINAKIETIDVPKWFDMLRNGWEDGLVIHAYGAAGYTAYLNRAWSVEDGNKLYPNTCKRSDQVTALMHTYFRLTDLNQMKATGQQIIQQMSSDEIAIPLWQQKDVYMLRDYVRDFKIGNPYETQFDGLKVWLNK